MHLRLILNIFVLIFLTSCAEKNKSLNNKLSTKVKVNFSVSSIAAINNYDKCYLCSEFVSILDSVHKDIEAKLSQNRVNALKDFKTISEDVAGEFSTLPDLQKVNAKLLDISIINDYIIGRVIYELEQNNQSDYYMIYNFCAKSDSLNNLHLIPYLDYSTQAYIKKIFNHNIFHINPEKKFTNADLDKSIALNDSLSSFFNSELITINYYIYRDAIDLFKCFGFDSYNEFNRLKHIKEDVFAVADIYNNNIHTTDFASIKHEIVHLYTKKTFNGHIHRNLDEGLATFLAGSVERDLVIDLRKLANIFKMRPKVFLFDNIFELDKKNVDEKTSYVYTIYGLLCKMVYEREGKKGLLEFVNCGTTEEDVYKSIEKHLHVNRKDLIKFIHTEIRKYCILSPFDFNK